jgi:hypothetical protein
MLGKVDIVNYASSGNDVMVAVTPMELVQKLKLLLV